MRHQTHHDGFSIVELIVAITVLGLFVTSLATVLNNLQLLNDRSRDLTLANGLAEKKIETLRSADYVALSDGTYDFTDELPATLTPPRSASYEVTQVNDSLRQIDLTITYSESGKERTIDFATFIGELGVGQ